MQQILTQNLNKLGLSLAQLHITQLLALADLSSFSLTQSPYHQCSGNGWVGWINKPVLVFS